MNRYLTMKERHQKEINDFPMFFAFNNEQFEKGMNKLGLQPSDTDKIYCISNTGGYIRKSDDHALTELFRKNEEERKREMGDDQFVFDMFSYELANHEYGYTKDISDTLDALGINIEEVNNNKRLSKILEKACKMQKDYK